MKKGITLIEVMGALMASSLIMLTIVRLTLFLINAEDRVRETNTLVTDAIVIQQNIFLELDSLDPTNYVVCVDHDICYEFYVNVADPHLIIGFDEISTGIYETYIYFDNETPFNIGTDNELRDVVFELSSCSTCTEKSVFKVEYTLRNLGNIDMKDLITRISFVVG